VTAMHVRDDGYTVHLDVILGIAVQAVSPVQAGVDDRPAMAGHWHRQCSQTVPPFDLQGNATLDFKCASGPGVGKGSLTVAVAPNCGGHEGAIRVDKPRHLDRLAHIHFCLALARIELKTGVQSIGDKVHKFWLRGRVTQARSKRGTESAQQESAVGSSI
jgi:hypothetical protein